MMDTKKRDMQTGDQEFANQSDISEKGGRSSFQDQDTDLNETDTDTTSETAATEDMSEENK